MTENASGTIVPLFFSPLVSFTLLAGLSLMQAMSALAQTATEIEAGNQIQTESQKLAGPISFSLPVRCTPGADCFIQNYVDSDAGPQAVDYACGTATYDGHTGVDFRLRSTRQAEAGVDVLAAAAGIVKAVRDGEQDALLRTVSVANIAGKECGNGIVIDHGAGWETQYCHMRKGSVAVRKGDEVSRSAVLGRVGVSGKADFAHLHFAVRFNRGVVDPFRFPPSEGQTCALDHKAAMSLWDPATRAQLPYKTGIILEAGFGHSAPSLADLEQGNAPPAPTKMSDQIIVYARAINLQAEDRLAFDIAGPEGFVLRHTTSPLDRSKAVYIAYAGKKHSAKGFPAGRYAGFLAILRGSVELERKELALELP